MGVTGDEFALIDRARGGDPMAVAELLRLWSPRIRRFAGRLCPATEVLDVVQETLLVLATKLNSLRSSQALVSWSFQIVRRHCIKAFSHIRRETALVRELGFLTPEQRKPNNDQIFLLEELARQLSSLPAKEREILVLRDIEGVSIREAAIRLAIGETAVKSRLHRARRELRRRMIAATQEPIAETTGKS